MDNIGWNVSTNQPNDANVANDFNWFAIGNNTEAAPSVGQSSTTVGAPSTAHFMLKAFSTGGTTQQVNITLAGTGSGTVTDNNGFTCSSGTCSHFYANGTVVTLTASSPNSTFAGWAGDGDAAGCGGTGSCMFTVSQSSNITATFNSQAPLIYAPAAHVFARLEHR